jgi:hypothetical protein
MRCGVQFPLEKGRKKGKGKNEEISYFISPSSLFSTAACERRGARNEGRRKNSLVNFSCYT